MSGDARISTGLPSHPKTLKLIRRLGTGSAWNLVCLFLWAASNRSDGDFTGMSDEDLELAAQWGGDEGVFVAVLADIRFLDGEEGAYCVHDWAEHNPWAAGAISRSYKARWNAAKRHHGEKEADRLVPQYAASRNADSNASSNAASKPAAVLHPESSNAPSPSPSPLPSPLPKQKQKALVRQAARYDEAFELSWAEYPKRGGGNSKAAAGKAWTARIRSGESAADMAAGVIRYAKFIRETGKEGTEFVKQAATFLGPDKHYLDDWIPPRIPVQTAAPSKTLSAIQRLEDMKNGLADTRNHDGLPETPLLGLGPNTGH